MRFRNFILLVTCIFSVEGAGSISKSEITIIENSHFMNYVNFPSNDLLTSCKLLYEYQGKIFEVEIDLNKSEIVGKENVQTKIQSLGRKICGITLTSFTKTDPTNYSFKTNYDKVEEKFDFSVKIKNIILPKTNILAFWGDFITINCQIEDGTDFGCIITNPQGNIVKNGESCTYSISQVAVNDKGKWKCVSSIPQNMEPIEFFINVDIKNSSKQIEGWYEEKDGFGLIGCRKLEETNTKSCQLIRPDGRSFTMTLYEGGGSTDRYTSIGTNLNNHICQIEFKLPHLQNEEGLWKCTVGDFSSFIPVKSDKIPDYSKYSKVFLVSGSSLDIRCSVPYEADYCYIEMPNGTILSGSVFGNPRNGECYIQILEYITSEVLGKWMCHFSKESSADDDVIVVEVVSSQQITYLSEVEVDENDVLELMCKSLAPILHCSFEDPNGKIYHVGLGRKSNEVDYVGLGLEYGQCGIKVKNIRKSQEGVWKCTVNNDPIHIGDIEYVEYTSNIRVEVNESQEMTPGKAIAIGLPVGIAIVAVFAISGILFQKYKKRQSHASDDNNSTSSSENIGAALNHNIVYYTN